MKILCISSIIPVPGKIAETDIILKVYAKLRARYGVDVEFVRPTIFTNRITRILRKRSAKYEGVPKGQTYSASGVKVVPVRFLFLARSPLVFCALSFSLRWIDRTLVAALKDYDIIHSHYGYPDGALGYLLSRKLGIPHVVTIRREEPRMTGPFGRFFYKLILKNAKAILTPNIFTKQFMEKSFGLNVTLVPHGIEDMFFAGDESPVKTDGALKVITIARLLKWKNVDVILRALHKVKMDMDFEYTIVGSGPEEARLKHLVEELGLSDRVHFLNQVEHSEIPGLLAKHHLFALLSYPETFGLVFIEAMARGLPIVCAKEGGIDGYFTDGVEGYAVDRMDSGRLADLIRLLNADRKRLAAIGDAAKVLATNFTWEKISSLYMTIYDDCLKERRSG